MAKKEAEVHGIRIKETRADRTFNVLNLIFWMIVLFITLYPLWLVLIASVSDPDAVLAGEVLFWPKGFSLMGYEAVFQHSELWQSYLNSIIYTVLGSALSVIVSLAAAYHHQSGRDAHHPPFAGGGPVLPYGLGRGIHHLLR